MDLTFSRTAVDSDSTLLISVVDLGDAHTTPHMKSQLECESGAAHICMYMYAYNVRQYV